MGKERPFCAEKTKLQMESSLPDTLVVKPIDGNRKNRSIFRLEDSLVYLQTKGDNPMEIDLYRER